MTGIIALVNKNDDVIGFEEKGKVHIEGLLHRAFSIFVFNKAGELMIHQRALSKYHTPGLWTNTCCSHLPKGMTMDDAVHQRLMDEMGFDVDLQYITKFQYRASFDNGLTENEIDHIYVGFYDGLPKPNPHEVENYAWIALPELKSDIEVNPQKYTYWLKHIIEHHYDDVNDARFNLK